MSDAPVDPALNGTPAAPAEMVGGSALPGGVMMRTRNRVGVAVRSEETGEILTDGFDLEPPTARWARWPLMRGVVAMRTAIKTGSQAMGLSERMRWGLTDDDEGEDEPLGWGAKLLIGGGAVVGAGLQVLAFRVGPIVIAKEAGLEGAAFIIADAAIRLLLLLATLLAISLFKPFRKILKYHGAEHQAIAAHEGGAPLTAAAAAGFTRFHPRCGTSFLVVSAVVSIAIYGAVLAITGVFTYPALIATRLAGAPVVTAIAFELQRQAAKLADGRFRFLSWPGMAAQYLTTRAPGHEELEVAVAALDEALRPPDPHHPHPAPSPGNVTMSPVVDITPDLP
ncbi:MAG: DUF1385 domain-containing protein [Thermoleophilia bacterium]